MERVPLEPPFETSEIDFGEPGTNGQVATQSGVEPRVRVALPTGDSGDAHAAPPPSSPPSSLRPATGKAARRLGLYHREPTPDWGPVGATSMATAGIRASLAGSTARRL
uniref:Uncharacterized protein n=1 Tax=Leersia perrieri TaxID=77586 RepID=A0A0D9VZX0_9ORYZ